MIGVGLAPLHALKEVRADLLAVAPRIGDVLSSELAWTVVFCIEIFASVVSASWKFSFVSTVSLEFTSEVSRSSSFTFSFFSSVVLSSFISCILVSGILTSAQKEIIM